MDNVVAIDGPGGAGKSTIARRLAEELGYLHLDTGAMYRAVTYAALQKGLDFNDNEALVKLANSIEIDFNQAGEIFLNGKNVSQEIRSPEVNQNVSKTAAVKGVREILVEKQQELAAQHKVVMDGRDITTVVLTEAEHKFYLTASIEERARRRFEEMKAKNKEANYKEIKENIARRDELDSQREHSPLKIADDAVVIDSTDLSIEEVVSKIKAIIAGE
ncbi:(d)CMP kinase [Halanaerobium sp. Z-7514]|uniref:Cytidylate kinase n=1 Tax=Halanaerobium polyolivorans TaxID=2886943 RepID=A0AAW4WUM6_9FIRM|nr:(d)CMP kinase [Halanaerobium polyolivorans]MCC3144807.1 (d)CMP kinase [Halanaerobium polyolivorans]